jgi:hypothetical protein
MPKCVGQDHFHDFFLGHGVFVEEFYPERKGICFPILIIET